MSGWLLMIWLASGEFGMVEVPEAVCRQVPAALARGELVTAAPHGRAPQVIVAALCFGPDAEDQSEGDPA